MDLYTHQNVTLTSESIWHELARVIKPNSMVYLESDVATFGSLADPSLGRKKFLRALAEIFLRLAGPDGHLIVPAFSYSWGSSSRDKTFDILKAKSAVGTLAEFLRTEPGFERTMDPMFSFSIHGPRRAELKQIAHDSFGPESVFAKMLRENAYLVSFGLNLYDPTFVHFVEQFVGENVTPCRYRSAVEFRGEWIDETGRRTSGSHSCYMRSLDSDFTFTDERLLVDLQREGRIQTLKLGGGTVHISDCQSVFRIGRDGMIRDPYYFVTKG